MAPQLRTQSRIHCPVSGCNTSFSRKADLLRHDDEKHGEMKFCSQPDCNYPGTKRAARLKDHMEREHPEVCKVPLNVPVGGFYSSQTSQVIDHTQGPQPTTPIFNPNPGNTVSETQISPSQGTPSTASPSWRTTPYPADPVTPVYQPAADWPHYPPLPSSTNSTATLAYHQQAPYNDYQPSESVTFGNFSTSPSYCYPTGDTPAQEYYGHGEGEGDNYSYSTGHGTGY